MKNHITSKGIFSFMLFLLLSQMVLMSKAQTYEWAYTLQNGTGSNVYKAMTIDNDQNVYTIGGVSSGVTDIDPGTNAFNTTPSNGPSFIQKLDKDGTFIWGGRLELSLSKEIMMTADKKNNVYIAGVSQLASYDVDIDTGAADTFFLHAANGDGFVVKMNEMGEVQWGVNFASNLAQNIDEVDAYAFNVTSLKTDEAENVYVTGYFRGQDVDFEPGSGMTLLSNDGGVDGFLLKLDKNGQFKWAVNIGGDQGFGINSFTDRVNISIDDAINDVVIDESGNVLILGYASTQFTNPLSNTRNIDMAPGADTFLFPIGEHETYVLKLDSTAQFKWVKKIENLGRRSEFNSYGKTNATHLFLTEDDGIVIAGDVSLAADFDPDTGVSNNYDATVNTGEAFENPSFLVKWSAQGTLEWLKINGGVIESVAQGGERFYITASLSSTKNPVDFDPDLTTYTAQFCSGCTNKVLSVVYCLDDRGEFVWGRTLEGTGSSGSSSFTNIGHAAGRFGDLYLVGNFRYISSSTTKYLDVNSEPSDTTLLDFSGAGIADNSAVLLKWSNGACTSNLPTFGSLDTTVCNIYVSPNGASYTRSGTYVDTFLNQSGCGDSILTINLTVAEATSATFDIAACYNYTMPGMLNTGFNNGQTLAASGTYVAVIPNQRGCDSTITVNLTIENTSSSLDTAICEEYTSPSGRYTWTASGNYMDTLTNNAGCDSIISIHLEILTSTFSTITATNCSSYTSPSGNYVWTKTGIYADTLVNQYGCDSFISISLLIPEINTTVLEEDFGVGKTFTAQETSAEYQWLGCSNSTYTPISDANKRQYNAVNSTENFVSLAITKEGCTDTTGCLETGKNVSIQLISRDDLKIYPNPTKANIFIESKDPITQLELRDMNGKVLINAYDKRHAVEHLDISTLPKGYYLLMLQTNQRVIHQKVIKE